MNQQVFSELREEVRWLKENCRDRYDAKMYLDDIVEEIVEKHGCDRELAKDYAEAMVKEYFPSKWEA